MRLTRGLGRVQRLAQAAQSTDSSSSGNHCKRFFSEEGRARMRLDNCLSVPVVPAGGAAGKAKWSAEAPSAKREGYDDPKKRPPQFNLLPPPPDERDHSTLAGACQPCLLSKLNISGKADLRLKDKPGDIAARKAANKAAPNRDVEASAVCLVPEPFYRAQRADQRVRAPAVAAGFEPVASTLYRDKMLFMREPDNRDTASTRDLGLLRFSLQNIGEHPCGSRQQLLNRVKMSTLKKSSEEWNQLCLMNGLGKFMTGKEKEVRLKEIFGYESLTYRELQFACRAKGQDDHGSRQLLVSRLNQRGPGRYDRFDR